MTYREFRVLICHRRHQLPSVPYTPLDAGNSITRRHAWSDGLRAMLTPSERHGAQLGRTRPVVEPVGAFGQDSVGG